MPQVFQRDNETIPTSDRIPVLPLRDVVIFPYVVIPLLVGRPASLAAIETALPVVHLDDIPAIAAMMRRYAVSVEDLLARRVGES